MPSSSAMLDLGIGIAILNIYCKRRLLWKKWRRFGLAHLNNIGGREYYVLLVRGKPHCNVYKAFLYVIEDFGGG